MSDHDEDGPKAALERELYWAEEATPRSRMDISEVREALHDFAALMRTDETQMIPRAEPNLAARKRWKRQLKLRLYRVIRPVSWRYDRLLADLGELNAALADRVAVLEAEVARLRAEGAERTERTHPIDPAGRGEGAEREPEAEPHPDPRRAEIAEHTS